MAKKKVKKPEREERYEYVRAIVDCGTLTFEYKLVDGPPNKMVHDEDVSDWDADQIRDVTRMMLTCREDDKIEVRYA